MRRGGSTGADPYDLERFVRAQASGGLYDRALAELRAGRKESHWMWFVFPQLRGLGRSPTAQAFGIASLAEARAYLAHPLLGPRLLACTEAVAQAAAPSASSIFGQLDALKLRSSMTLFSRAAPDEPLFQRVLDRFFGGEPDPLTDERLA
jgi:uncharacterized protein (DUF1810 family)